MLTSKFKGLNASQLKYLAAFLMFLDHIHQMFHAQGAPFWLTAFGRLVFPIFLFAAADGFHYTRNRKAYLWRLLLGSWLMVITSNVLQSILPNDNVVLMNNAFSTFFVTGVLIVGWDKIKAGVMQKTFKSFIVGILIFALPFVAVIPMMLLMNVSMTGDLNPIMMRVVTLIIMMIPSVMTIEGGIIMALLGLAFYIFREKRLLQVAVLIGVSIWLFMKPAEVVGIQWMMGFAAIPMLMYNGQKGNQSKWFFYIFYPAHIYGLYILSTLLFK